MEIIISLLIGGIVGWLAARVAGHGESVLGSIVIGIIGSCIGAIVSARFINANGSLLAFSWGAIFWAFIGSLILAALLNMLEYRQNHPDINL